MRYYLITLFLALALSASASDEVVVVQSSGQVSWSISSIKDITFDGNGVKFSFNDNTSVYYDKGSLSMIKFDTTLSGINSINKSEQTISIADNCIIVEGNTSEIKVFSLSGAAVAQGKGPKLDISSLEKGTYIVQAGSLISKIIKK